MTTVMTETRAGRAFDPVPSWRPADAVAVDVVTTIPADTKVIGVPTFADGPVAMGAAGYRFGDYWRLGLVTMAVFFVVAVFVVLLFWPF